MMRLSCSNKRAFSLPEVLVVVGIAAALLGLVAGSFSRHRDREAPREFGRRFAWLIEEARVLARTERTPVRLVFVTRRLVTGTGGVGEGDIVDCRLFQFVVPKAAQPEVAWRAPGTQHAVRGGDALERIPSAPPGLPECLVGKWQSVAMKPLRLRSGADQDLQIESPLLEKFKAQSIEEYAAENAWRPAQYWSESPANAAWEQLNPRSIYPPDYDRTPFPHGLRLVRGSLPSDAKVYDPQGGEWRLATEYWGDSPTEYYNLNGAQQNLQDLPFIEFDGRGECQSRWTGNLSFTFSLPKIKGAKAEVVLSQETGIARLREQGRAE